MPWMVPQNKLDSEQRAVLDALLKGKGSDWIRGFAGSGKSIILMHSLRETLIKEPRARVCVVTFTHALKDMLATGLPANARHLPVMTYHEFRSEHKNEFFDYIFVDEVQYLEPDVLVLLESKCTRLIMAGDEKQSIYEGRVSPSEIKRQTAPTMHNLTIVHRLSEKLRKIVEAILPSAQLKTAKQGNTNAEVKISLAKATNKQNEYRWIWNHAQKYAQVGDPVCILLPKHRLVQDFIDFVCAEEGIPRPDYKDEKGRKSYESCNEHLMENGLILRYLGNSHGTLDESDQESIVYVMTYHSSKGLDFETVILPGMDSGLSIFKKNSENLERTLFYVASTRSRRNLFISYTGDDPHPFVAAMPKKLIHNIAISDETGSSGSSDSDDDYY
jgi:superfamily I DNA/RNA helicase